MPRGKRIGIRLTDQEHDYILEYAGRLHVSEFVRAQALGRHPRLPRQIPEVNREAWRDLARCLGNLNQMAAAIHRGQVPADPSTGKTLLSRIDEVNAHVRDLRAELIGADQEPVR